MAPGALVKWFLNEPTPVRKAFKAVIRELKLGPYSFRYDLGALPRPNYAFLVYNAAQLAVRLGEPRVSILEFGVAGGSGLIALERHAEEVERLLPVKIEIYGFDTGEGLPDPVDYRDLPYQWRPGFFKMDVAALKSRLGRSKLVLGNVCDTVPSFLDRFNPAPIGAVSHDMDFYSSTAAGLRIFDDYERAALPRVVCYFDDTIGDNLTLYNEWTGQRLAIAEFNEARHDAKLSPAFNLRAVPAAPIWYHQVWSAHFFAHSRYGEFVAARDQQLPLT